MPEYFSRLFDICWWT